MANVHLTIVTQTMITTHDTNGNPRKVTLVKVISEDNNMLITTNIRECHSYVDGDSVKSGIIQNVIDEYEKNGVNVTYNIIPMTNIDITPKEYKYQKGRAGYNNFFAK